MSLQKIKLPEGLIPGLYKQSLVPDASLVHEEPAEPKAPEAVAETPAAGAPLPYKFLGNNMKKVSIVVDFPGEAFLPETHLQFLTKILEACKMNLGDVAIVNHASRPVIAEELKQQLQPRYMLLLGVDPLILQLPISFPPFKDQAYAGCTYLSAPSIHELNQNSAEARVQKSKLWVSLKTLFGI